MDVGSGNAVEMTGLAEVGMDDVVGLLELVDTWVADVVVEDFFASAEAIVEARKSRLNSQWYWKNMLRLTESEVVNVGVARVGAWCPFYRWEMRAQCPLHDL